MIEYIHVHVYIYIYIKETILSSHQIRFILWITNLFRKAQMGGDREKKQCKYKGVGRWAPKSFAWKQNKTDE